LKQIRRRIKAAAEKNGRKSENVTLVAVTKTRSEREIAELKTLGIRIIGESRVQELAEKYPALKGSFEIHFIGHLQTNKVKQAVEMADMIHSVDSFKVASAIEAECQNLGKQMDVLLQVNTSSEPQKSGVTPEGLEELLLKVSGLQNLRVRGLMTMAMISEDNDKIRACFRKLREIREEILRKGADPAQFLHLSMGMSDDFELAVEEGATLVRVGSALFTES